jgi:hypothetical protein
VEQTYEPMNNWMRCIQCRTSGLGTTKSISIKGTGCKSGGCVRKAGELASGDRVSAEGIESLAAQSGTESLAIGESLMEEVRERGKLQAGIGTSQGQQRKPWRGWDDRPRIARVPETTLASHSGTVGSAIYAVFT